MQRILFFLLFVHASAFAGTTMSRHVVTFWDSKTDDSLEESMAAKMIELPLNYLGLDVEYHDIQNPLPDISKRDDVRGVVICFNAAVTMADPIAFLQWAISAFDSGKKVIILSNPGFLANNKGLYTSISEINRLYERIGFTTTNASVDYTYGYKVVFKDPTIVGFEKEYPELLPAFNINKVNAASANSFLTVGMENKPESLSDLIVISPYGAYVSEKFANNLSALNTWPADARFVGWYINPFFLFETVFGLSTLPIPDTTTLAGRRIFFTYSDGDSWNVPTEIEKFRGKGLSCAEVMLEEVVKTNPDIPTSMGVIAADVDVNWVGTEKSQRVAREFFAQPQVEAASHSYSHPFQWSFFENDPHGEKEIYFLHLYPYGSWQNSFISWFRAKYYEQVNPKGFSKQKLKWGYTIPRAYANQPFNLEKEITGSVNFLNQFMPDNQKIKLLLWSGDGKPWGEAVKLCYQNGIANLGGGQVRLDPEYPSLLLMSPLGRKPGGFKQIYSVSNAEVSYTFDWSKRFYGFKFLPVTLENTDKPRRLKPAAVYYHSYSAQFDESLRAVLDNLAFIRTQHVIPIHASEYVDIGLGFYSVDLERLEEAKWKVKNRGGLQTIRFDHAHNTRVNLLNSVGVVGFMHHQNSLYVYLDAGVAEPIVQLQQSSSQGIQPYLVDSSWEIWNVVRNAPNVKFTAKGWGKLEMNWSMPTAGRYIVNAGGVAQEFTTNGQQLKVVLELPYNTPTEVSITRQQ